MDPLASHDAQLYRPQHIHAPLPAAYHRRPSGAAAAHPPSTQQPQQPAYASHAHEPLLAAHAPWGGAADYRHHPYPPLHAPHSFPPPHGGGYGEPGPDGGPYAAPYHHGHHHHHPGHPHAHPHAHHRSPIPQLPRRVRCTQACNHCHRRKARCVRNIMPDGSAACDNCLREGIPCEWRASRRRGPKRRRNGSGSSHSHDSPPQDSPTPACESPVNDPPRPTNAASLANLLNTTTATAAA
ncbi:hypothetical protein IWQ57_007037, partial [Coemansia nantahalensis]